MLVSQATEDGAPVVFETNPTYYNLFGRIEYEATFGALSTDHRHIKPGALHRANGGYLMLDALDVLAQPFVWAKLKETLRTRAGRDREHRLPADAVPDRDPRAGADRARAEGRS